LKLENGHDKSVAIRVAKTKYRQGKKKVFRYFLFKNANNNELFKISRVMLRRGSL